MDHDRLFKELIETFFLDFIGLFLPEVERYLDPTSIEFISKEVFIDITAGERNEVDLLVKAKFKGRDTFFLIHIENQSTPREGFGARMFRYFARLHEKHALPVYPIALFSFDSPQKEQPDTYTVEFPDMQVMTFRFKTIQLNRLNWRDFLRKPNPVAAALMTKMRIDPADRPKVKLECLRMIATLKLDMARQTLIRTFMDSYLRLSAQEMSVYNRELEAIDPPERKAVMSVVNEWEQIGEERGIRAGESSILRRMIARKFGELPNDVADAVEGLPKEALESLADALFDFNDLPELRRWLGRLA